MLGIDAFTQRPDALPGQRTRRRSPVLAMGGGPPDPEDPAELTRLDDAGRGPGDGAPLALHVLIVDDDAATCEVLDQGITGEGCWVARATSGREAMQLLDHHLFQAAIVDMLMPDMDGLVLLSHIREQHREVDVIVLSGMPDPDREAAALRLGAVCYREKPFDIAQLRRDLEGIALRHGAGPTLREVLETIGANVRRWRKDLGLRLRDLSERSGLSVPMLSQIEHAATALSLTALVRLAKVLDRDVRDFFVKPR